MKVAKMLTLMQHSSLKSEGRLCAVCMSNLNISVTHSVWGWTFVALVISVAQEENVQQKLLRMAPLDRYIEQRGGFDFIIFCDNTA